LAAAIPAATASLRRSPSPRQPVAGAPKARLKRADRLPGRSRAHAVRFTRPIAEELQPALDPPPLVDVPILVHRDSRFAGLIRWAAAQYKTKGGLGVAHDIESIGTCPERSRDEFGDRAAVCGDQWGSAVTAEKHQVGIAILWYQCHFDPSRNGKSERVAARFAGSDAACCGDLRMFVIERAEVAAECAGLLRLYGRPRSRRGWGCDGATAIAEDDGDRRRTSQPSKSFRFAGPPDPARNKRPSAGAT